MKLIRGMKMFFQVAFMLAIVGAGAYSIFLRESPNAWAMFTRQNLQGNESNLDILYDKDGSLDDLIGEIQGYKTYITTGYPTGSTIPVTGILPTDTIRSIVVHTSAAVVCGSTVIGNPGDGQILLQSKVWGWTGFYINASIFKKGATIGVSSGALSINTTGYAFAINTSTGENNIQASSANAIVNAINSHPWLGTLVLASTFAAANSFSTETIKTVGLVNQLFFGNAQTVYVSGLSTRPADLGTYVLDGQFATITSSGNVVISTAAPISRVDGLELKTYGYRGPF